MAAQVDDAAAEVTPEMVGHAFVSQFYHILHESPDLVHKYYQDSSTMTRPGCDGKLNTVTTMKGIDELIHSLDCKDYKAEILTADAHASHMDGVLVLVTGCLTGKDNIRRKFTESFFLAPQDKGAYFVLNDAFRFIEEDSSPAVNSVEEKEVESAPEAPMTAGQETVEVPNNSSESRTAEAEATAENKTETINVPRDEQKSTVKETSISQAAADSSQSVQPVIEASSNGHVKVSYASLLKNVKEGASTTLVRAPTVTAKAAKPNASQKSVASPAGQQPPADVVPATPSESSAPNGVAANGSSAATGSRADQAEVAEGHSIYIGDLPWDATAELVEREFKKFGRIKRNGIQVRSNKGYCFGFVEYEDASAQQKAVEMGAIKFGGKEAFIQEKKTSTRVVNGVSTYPNGRGGGFRNDGFRGRGGNFSNGRGYARNDYNNRRNGDGVYQNGGGRGGRQGVAAK